ncbi:nucleotide sugar dehydrogenase [Halorubellus sp. PRR65]|uniref:nucleotide sugar dehydrogenase n=1 Tax=Halorubellus sp. PRR65 TaxID=3098148 RepID=UPI002B25DD81|nr:nucleotide sugar dehydrogenase [Halorubellus sp. PRR65]
MTGDGAVRAVDASRRPAYDPAASDDDLREAFLAGEIPVAVYGLGKMGLPLAAVYADVCGNVTGVDIDEAVVETVSAGDCHVEREPGLPALVADVVDRGALSATADPVAAARAASVHVLMVPTLLDGHEPDLSTVEAALESIGAGLSPGDLVVVECTVPPRTTRDVVVPTLARISGLEVGEFGAAACPERTSSGRALEDVRGAYPKVVGGVDAESTRVASVLYGEIAENDVVATSDAATAEAVKVFEGVYRDVNIAVANQLALYARPLDVDVNEAIDVANTQPYCDIHTPGPGVGGHCIPVYPYFLAGAYPAVDADLLHAARGVNDAMPEHAVALLEAMLEAHGVDGDAPTVLVLGLAYRGNVAELRYSPGPVVARELAASGMRVLAADPFVDDWSSFEGVERVPMDAVAEQDVDAVAVLAGHDEFRDLDWAAFDAPVLDGRFVLPDDVDAPVYTVGGRWPR